MLFTLNRVAPKRARGRVVWCFVFLLVTAVAGTFGSPGSLESPGATVTAATVVPPAAADAARVSRASGGGAVTDAVVAAGRATVRELTTMVRAVPRGWWWPFEITLSWLKMLSRAWPGSNLDIHLGSIR